MSNIEKLRSAVGEYSMDYVASKVHAFFHGEDQ